MPTITASDEDWIAIEAIRESQILQAVRGCGMHMKLDEKTLRTLVNSQSGDTFQVEYVCSVDTGSATSDRVARLRVSLDDPHGLFAGHSIIAVLGNLLAQIVEARLT